MIYQKQVSTRLKLERIVIIIMMMVTRTTESNGCHLMYTHCKNVLIYSTKLYISTNVNAFSETHITKQKKKTKNAYKLIY